MLSHMRKGGKQAFVLDFISFGINFLLFADIVNLREIMFPTDSTGSTYFPQVFRPTGTHSLTHSLTHNLHKALRALTKAYKVCCSLFRFVVFKLALILLLVILF